MTCWIQPSAALAQQLGIPVAPLPVSAITAAAIDSGTVDPSALASDVDMFLEQADPADNKTDIIRRCAAAIASVAANGSFDDAHYEAAAELYRMAVRHAPEDPGMRASYGAALWMSGRRFDGLAQLTAAVQLNSVQGRMVPMLWILTARAMADAGRYGNALLLLEDLALTEPSDYRFWELIDSIDARNTGPER